MTKFNVITYKHQFFYHSNVSDPVKNWDAVTNDSAELRAIVTVLEIAAELGMENVFIVTDSDMAVDTITKLEKLATWIRCDWKGLNNSKLELKNLYEEFICKMKPIKQLKFVSIVHLTSVKCSLVTEFSI